MPGRPPTPGTAVRGDERGRARRSRDEGSRHLGVEPGAIHSDLKQCYKRESLKVHPDKIAPDLAEIVTEEDKLLMEDAAGEALRALRAAYEALSDTQKRDMYNKLG